MLAAKDELFTRPSGGYTIARSVRTRASASAYFNRTLTTPTGAGIWTFSAWVKRGLLDSTDRTLVTAGSALSNFGDIYFQGSTSKIIITFYQTSLKLNASTSAVFRDPSAWYHIIVAVDMSQATSTNGCKIWINGVQQTLTISTYVQGSGNSPINSALGHSIGSDQPYASSGYFDGYLTEINFVDGQQLTPSSFGTTNAITGVWQPAKYTGTYGTNGFYLNFSDNSAVTTSSNVGIGKDFSGNANYWTSNNINVTAYSGSPSNNVSYDSMVDSPTVGSLSSNYCVLNPLSNDSSNTLSGGNLNWSIAAAGNGYPTSTFQFDSGKWYWEVTISGIAALIAIALGSTDPATAGFTSGYGYYQQTGNKWVNGSNTAYGSSYTSGDVIGVAVDMTALTVTFYKNNVSQGAISIAAGLYKVSGGNGSSGTVASGSYNFGQRPFSYTPPTGFVALNTYNLPASTAPIPNGANHMNATIYTGTGTNPRTFTGLAFQPDWIWNKSRSNSGYGALWDSVRGGTKALQTYSASSETTIGTAGGTISSFNSDGATFANGSINDSWFNTSAVTYVSWQWKAGGTAVSNTSGSITSSVSANTTAGFSVVTYTGTGANATVGHGLNAVPKMVIVKCRSVGIDWNVYHVSQNANPASGALTLDSNAGFVSDNTYWNGPTGTFSSTLFSIGSGAANNAITATYVAYCFAAVAGYSAFGSYTGNNDPNGPFVFLGFRPRWILVKSTAATTNWHLQDTSRSPYNAANNLLFPNLSNGDYTTAGVEIDILSNGFKIRDTNADYNASGNTFIYMAFAENPFQNALAR